MFESPPAKGCSLRAARIPFFRGGGAPTGKIAELINRDFGSYDAFKAAFKDKGATQFGSGWAWLVSAGGKLHVTNTLNAHTPVEDADATPLASRPIGPGVAGAPGEATRRGGLLPVGELDARVTRRSHAPAASGRPASVTAPDTGIPGCGDDIDATPRPQRAAIGIPVGTPGWGWLDERC